MTGALMTLALLSLGRQPSVQCVVARGVPHTYSEMHFALTADGRRAAQSLGRLFLVVKRTGVAGSADGAMSYVRELPRDGDVTFLFGKAGAFEVRVTSGPATFWPNEAGAGSPVEACTPQVIRVTDEQRPEFEGVRVQAWSGWQPLSRAVIGGSVFVERLGFSGEAAVVPAPKQDSSSRWTAEGHIDYRGARGYLGGGFRYFPDAEPGLRRLRPLFAFGEELPAFKGRPVWFAFELRVDGTRWAVPHIATAFTLRWDLTGNRP
jgi:hypothetical protein